jgi:phytoene dehydrogenase-like protein/imidazolonepropionase-like amidohydrolase
VEKTIAIIGAGIAGLSAGCYARMNGYRATIFELHDKPGGLCTAWRRDGYTIDGCIHWLIGSKPGTSFYKVWEELGAVQERQFIYADEYQRYEAKDGRTFILYADIDRLERHMLELAPEDRDAVREFCDAARGFLPLELPVGKPRELMNLCDYLKVVPLVAKYLPVMRWNRLTMSKVLARFKNPLIRAGILQAWPGTFPAGFLLTAIASLHNRAAGYPVGGSLEFARAIEQRYLSLGGELKYQARVAKILVENDRAVGVRLDDGTEHRADYVVSAADAHATIFDLLGGDYVDATVRGYFDKLTPYTALVFVGLGINRKFDDVPAMVSSLRLELPEPVRIADRERSFIGFHVFNHDPSLAPAGKTAVVSAFASSLEWWQSLRPDANRYHAAKEEVADRVIRLLDRRFPGVAGQVEVRDVATPVTFVRRTGNWQGSVQGWSATPHTWMMQFRKTLPGLKNLWLCGQWVEPIGGLPPAALSGRNAVQILCAQDRKRFVTTVPRQPAAREKPPRGGLAHPRRGMILALLSAIALAGARTAYIRAGKVFDGQKLIGSRVISVRDGLIQAIEDADFAVPEGAEVIDAGNSTVLPGFVDSHIHFMAAPLPYIMEIEKHGWGKLAAEGMSAFPEHRFHLLQNGVTTIADMGSPLAGYLDLRNARQKRSIVGPELYFPGPLITAPGGHPAGTIYVGQHDLIDNGTFQVADPAAVRKKVADLAAQGVDFIKIVYDRMWYRKGGAPRLKLEVARAAIEEAHRFGLSVFAHVGSEEEARAMVHSGVDGIEHGFKLTSDTLLKEMAAQGISFTPTICAYVHYAPAAAPHMQQTLKRAYDLGVPLCVGTDFPASYGESAGDDIFREMKLFEEVGVPRIAVLRAATSAGAAKLGRDKELGMIAPGHRADLVFVAGSIDTGALSADRILSVMLHGETVVENQKLAPGYARQFRESSTSFFGYPYWDPLLSFLIGASATDFDLFRTGITASADLLFSTRNMWAANLALAFPSPIPRTALRAGAHFDNQNRLFYGIGNDTKLNDTTEYASLIFREGVSGTTRIAGHWKVASSLLFEQSKVSPYRSWSLPDTVAGNRGGNEAAFSLSLVHDARDHENNPWYGHYVAAGAWVAPAILAGGHSFRRVSFDARGYVSPFHKHILAGRLLYLETLGDVPFYYLPEIGGDTLGRGYLPYRFRDRIGLYGQFEYRFPIWDFLSGAAFVDVCQVQSAVGKFTTGGFHPAVGFGPRFSFGANENSILAIDVGITPEGWNLVLHNGHAF